MLQKIKAYIHANELLEQGDKVVVGVSGGADSVALLLVLNEIKAEFTLQLYAVHINHGIRKEASHDADFSRKLCEQLEIPFSLFEANIPAMAKEQGKTEEEMGRIYRYQCFEEVRKKLTADKIAVAHHMDDQAETLLFHLVRGSHLAGMEGMQPMAENKVIRPLLSCRKEEIVAWLAEHNVSWCEDATNADNVYARNSIRNEVLPVLGRINNRAVEHMAEFAKEMTAYKAYIQRDVDAYLQKHVQMEPGVSCVCEREHLLRQNMVLGKAVIYEMLVLVCGRRKDIGRVHVDVVYDLMTKQSGRRRELPYQMLAEISYEKLIIRKSLKENVQEDACLQKFYMINFFDKETCTTQEWETLTEEARNSKNNYTKYFDCGTIKDTLCVRRVRPEDYFVFNDKGDRKKVSRYLIDEKISVEQRKSILVLAMENKVLWILGKRRCEEYKVTKQSKHIMKVTYKGEEQWNIKSK